MCRRAHTCAVRFRENSGRSPNSSQYLIQKVWKRERKIPSLLYMLCHLTFRNYLVIIFFSMRLKQTFKSFPSSPSGWGLNPSAGSTWPCGAGAVASSHGPPTGGHHTLSPPGLCLGCAPRHRYLQHPEESRKNCSSVRSYPLLPSWLWRRSPPPLKSGGEARSLRVESEDSSQTWVQILAPLLTS